MSDSISPGEAFLEASAGLLARAREQMPAVREAARWFAVDPEGPQGRVIAMPQRKRRKAQ